MAMKIVILVVFSLELVICGAVRRSSCPCTNSKHCQLVTNTPAKEIFTFCVSNKNYLKYDWEKVTTLVGFEDCVNDTITCYAHSKGVKVSFGADYDVRKLTDPASRTEWVTEKLQFAEDHFLDGINFDFEAVIRENDTASKEGLNDLLLELTEAFHKTGRQVTFDTPPNPNGARHYDFARIGELTDFIVVMAYDLYGPCVIGANSYFRISAVGVYDYTLLNIPVPPEKMVLALPWYGYDYPCATLKDNVCTVSSTNCGRKDGYDVIMSQYVNQSTTGVLWNRASVSPYLTYKDEETGGMRQIWFDNVTSLRIKYGWAERVNLRGVGMWHADYLLYDESSEARKQQKDMWGALPGNS